MLRKKCLAFLCAVVLLAAVLASPVSALKVVEESSGGSNGKLYTTAELNATYTSAQATTGPVVKDPSPNPTTIVNLWCRSAWTEAERWMSGEGDYSASATRPDSSYNVWEARSTHIVNSAAWGYWYKQLSIIP